MFVLFMVMMIHYILGHIVYAMMKYKNKQSKIYMKNGEIAKKMKNYILTNQ